MDYVGNQENVEVLESGEVILKEWNEDAKALEKLKKDHGSAMSDRKSLKTKNEELSKKVTELTEQFSLRQLIGQSLDNLCSLFIVRQFIGNDLNARCHEFLHMLGSQSFRL